MATIPGHSRGESAIPIGCMVSAPNPAAIIWLMRPSVTAVFHLASSLLDKAHSHTLHSV